MEIHEIRTGPERGYIALLRDIMGKHPDLLAVGASNLALLIVAALPPTVEPLRVVLALFVALVTPGYALLAALLPRPTDLEPMERIALSFGLSIFIVTAIAFALNTIHIGIRTFPLIVSMATFSLACAAAAQYRRRSLSAEEQLGPQFVNWIPVPRRLAPFGQKAAAGLALLAVVAVIGVFYTVLVARPFSTDHLTQFYLLDRYGSPEALPLTVPDGAEAEVILGIGNREGRPLKYVVELWIQGEYQRTVGEFNVPNGEVAEATISFTVSHTGTLQRVEFRLFRPGDLAPYREVYLWVQ